MRPLARTRPGLALKLTSRRSRPRAEAPRSNPCGVARIAYRSWSSYHFPMPPSESELRQEYARRRKRQWLIVIPVVVIVLIAMHKVDAHETYLGLSSTVVLLLCLGIILGARAFSIYSWRCPACSTYVGRGNPTFCPECEFKLKEG